MLFICSEPLRSMNLPQRVFVIDQHIRNLTFLPACNELQFFLLLRQTVKKFKWNIFIFIVSFFLVFHCFIFLLCIHLHVFFFSPDCLLLKMNSPTTSKQRKNKNGKEKKPSENAALNENDTAESKKVSIYPMNTFFEQILNILFSY